MPLFPAFRHHLAARPNEQATMNPAWPITGSPVRYPRAISGKLSLIGASRMEGDVVSFAMSQAEREEFLAGVHVGVLTVAARTGRAPLAIPVWYGYSPGGLVSVPTGQATQKARAIAAAGRFSL